MKKIVSVLLALMLVSALALPVFAAELSVVFTADSQPVPGRAMTVDKNAMLALGSNTADTYNAMLEGNVIYNWYKNGLLHNSGTGSGSHSYQIQQEDVGSKMKLVIEYYEDNTFRTKVGTAVSEEFTVGSAAVPEITTKSLPDATVGQTYYVKLQCTDGDAVFSEFMGSQLYEFGMTLTQHGEIEGTPAKTGNCHVNVMVVGEGGENSFSFDITVKNVAEPQITTQTLPEATAGTAYSAKITCTDSKAEIGVYYNPGKANDFEKTGLTLSKDGQITGTPKGAGSYTFTVYAAGAGGEDYKEYTLLVKETHEVEAPTVDDAEQTTPTTEKPVENKPVKDKESKSFDKDDDEEEGLLWWVIALIGLAAAGAGVGAAALLVRKNHK